MRCTPCKALGVVVMLFALVLSPAWSAESTRGANDATRQQALKVAEGEYIQRYGVARDAMEGPVTRKFRIGYDVPEFADKGDEIWEVRFEKDDGSTAEIHKELRADFWVNAKINKLLFISGRGVPQDPTRTEGAALARKWYEQNVGKLEATLRLETTDLVLDYDVADFAPRGSRVLEVRVRGPEGLRGVLWVNPDKGGKVKPIAGVWQATTKPATSG
jgi:hypothetical protein